MKKISTVFLSLLLLMGLTVMAQGQISKEERTFAVKHLTKTQSEILKTLKGLSEEQLNFKPNAESWSVAECLRHIAISESALWQNFMTQPLSVDADPSKRSEVAMTDEILLGVIESREQKVKTFAPFEPQNKPEPVKDVIKEFKKLRGEHIKFAKKTDADLRNHYATLPFGTIDTYQAILFMSGHTKRHTDQMKEVMADPSFPKK
ncbi:DinB family protein [Roseivirga sp. E12]|uniref:DinB family protein n=1 Tax=Roseivirga sp. E12 TaxID=2819237 RepID=UPI001ABD4671|nr:DinB family protein [Roseivirga sp. E12]MBO3697367.1 DinB family protein [Roseivirga sp. E12]